MKLYSESDFAFAIGVATGGFIAGAHFLDVCLMVLCAVIVCVSGNALVRWLANR